MKVKIGILIYKVEFTHKQNIPGIMTNVFGRKRVFVGATICQVYRQCAGNNLLRVCGVAYQNEADEYTKERGRKISLARAIKEFTKANRKKFWEAYLTRGEETK